MNVPCYKEIRQILLILAEVIPFERETISGNEGENTNAKLSECGDVVDKILRERGKVHKITAVDFCGKKTVVKQHCCNGNSLSCGRSFLCKHYCSPPSSFMIASYTR